MTDNYVLVDYSDDLDLSSFYEMAKKHGYENNTSIFTICLDMNHSTMIGVILYGTFCIYIENKNNYIFSTKFLETWLLIIKIVKIKYNFSKRHFKT